MNFLRLLFGFFKDGCDGDRLVLTNSYHRKSFRFAFLELKRFEDARKTKS